MSRCPMVVALVFLAGVPWAQPVAARDIHVDPDLAADESDGNTVRTIRQAIRQARPGDTIHLRPIVYRESACFYGTEGEPDRPIILDGHGATLEGSEPLDPGQWQQVEAGLYRCDDLLDYLDDAIIGRWYFLWNGRMNRMGRTLKGPSAPLKKPLELQPGEWTFVKDPTRTKPRPLQIAGSFYIRLPQGQTPAEANILVPTRAAGVQFDARGDRSNSHLVIRNVTCTHVYNDGFNIHGNCKHVRFENIRAIECGDDGISAHEATEYRVDGLVSIGNSTGICDTGSSQTAYDRVFIRDCLGMDLSFFHSGHHSVSNAIILSSASTAVRVSGDGKPAEPCTLELNNIFIQRITGSSAVRLDSQAVLDARRLTMLGLNITATAGEIRLHDSIVADVPARQTVHPTYDYLAASAGPRGPLVPEIRLSNDVQWTADRNQYVLKALHIDRKSYSRTTLGDHQSATGQDSQSEWVDQIRPESGAGADHQTLTEMLGIAPDSSPAHTTSVITDGSSASRKTSP